MDPLYIKVLETRLECLKWSQTFDYPLTLRIMPSYRDVLERATTYVMDKHFCQLVEHARALTPDSLTFDATWLHSQCGWMYLEEPFHVPPIQAALTKYQQTKEEWCLTEWTQAYAIGWRALKPGTVIPDNARTNDPLYERVASPGAYQFLVFMQSKECFYPWSSFTLRDGQALGPRVKEFEEANSSADIGDAYVVRPGDKTLHPYHEMRWIFTALYLMSQRLASKERHDTDRATRRRAERNKQVAPPFLEVVTLRRLQHDRESTIKRSIDWQWQWHVRGHWREQWYPLEGLHKPKFIEAYMKGPAEKPVKPPTITLFAAVR